MDKPWFSSYEPEVPRSLESPVKTMTDILDEVTAKNPRSVAVSFFGNSLSYAKLVQQVEQFATALTRLGIRQGDRIAIMLPNVPQYPILHFATMRIGAVLVPTNPLYVERELKYQLNDSEAETIVALDFHFPRIEKIRSETGLRNIILTKTQEYLPLVLKYLYPLQAKKKGNWYCAPRVAGVHLYEDLLTEPFRESTPEIPVKPDDVAMLLYTGGTTGVGKGAILTHGNLLSNVMQIRSWYTAVREGQESILCALPFFHSYGLTTCLHLSILLGSRMVLIPDPRDIKKILQTIQKEKITLFSGVPTLFVAINHFSQVSRYDLTSIKACVSGGAALPLEVARQFEAITGGKLVEGYGLSEASPVTHANPIHGKRKEGSIGLPLPGTDARVVGPKTKKTLAVGGVGELAIKGPQVMRGYWKMEQETSAALKDGWLFTGDIARMDEEGYFYIVDRKKDMIIAGGFNIYPREIEEVLYEHPKVVEAAVIGVPDEYRGETVKAYLVCKNGETLSPEEIVQFCKERLAPFKVPKLIEFRECLPKSNIGKVLRRILKDEIDT